MIPLDPAANPVDLVDLVDLTRALVDTPSESGDEAGLADAVESALRAHPHLGVVRVGNSVVARTDTGRAERVIIAGHLDTVPAAGNLPSRLDGERLYGLGACDMKGGVAIALRLAAGLAAPVRDVTYVFYECEEVAGDRNGLKRIAADRPDLLEADLAILMEPSDAGVEAGCQGVLNADITVRASAPTPPAPGWASTRRTERPPHSGASTTTAPSGSSSTDWSTARGSTRSPSVRASPTTSSPTPA
ncbi:hypothetical protein SPURM210S_01556 [Streptomyces purpurascens]